MPSTIFRIVTNPVAILMNVLAVSSASIHFPHTVHSLDMPYRTLLMVLSDFVEIPVTHT